MFTTILFAVPGSMSAQHSAPACPAEVGLNEKKVEKKLTEKTDRGEGDKAALPNPEVLCERTQFGQIIDGDGWPAFMNLERTSGKAKKPRGVYGLSSVTIPPAAWQIHAVVVYTAYPGKPEGWLKLKRARLNVFPKNGDLLAAEADPRVGRDVEITVRQLPPLRGPRRTIYEVRASDLRLTLTPGEYWVGLTPICSDTTGTASHVLAGAVNDARFEDVVRDPGGEEVKEWRNWTAINNHALGAHLSIRIEGRHVPRGQVLKWPMEKSKGAKLLHLRFGTFDPLVELPTIAKKLTAPEDGKLWIVQCKQTVDQQTRDQLAQAGATLLRYLPDDAYIVRLNANTLKEVRKISALRWVGPYHPAYRLDPNVSPEPVETDTGRLSPEGEPNGRRSVLVYVFERDAETKKEVAQVIRDAGGKVVFQSPKGFFLAADVPLDRLEGVVRCDAVCAVERRFGGFKNAPAVADSEKGFQPPAEREKGIITLSQIRELCGADGIRKAAGYEGLGVRVAFWDERVREDHIDLLARPLTILGPTLWSDAHHGTAVASILCGEGRGDPRARGILPLGGLVFAPGHGDPVHADRYGWVDRFVRDYRTVVLSSSSRNWNGSYHIKHYDGYSLLLDDLVSEYDLLICEAIGNSTGSGNGRTGSWAKNALLIGGIDPRGSLRREDHRHGESTSGPAPDGRIRPDLVHFCDGIFCANASSPKGYGSFGGTSCATPLAAGHCGLMMEMWADGVFGNLPLGRTVFDRRPHAATAKALMINSAYRYPIEGTKPIFTRFKQGWGMPDLGRLYESRKRLFVVDQEIALRDHQAVEYQLRVPENEPELRVTMVYTDPLGTIAAAKALVNDLDLVVIAPDGKRYLGNHGLLESNLSKEGGAPDRLNNVENVFLEKPASGVWRVIVAAHRIASDQHRATAAWDQDFALVISGVEPVPVARKPAPN
jgi:serine protease AprX